MFIFFVFIFPMFIFFVLFLMIFFEVGWLTELTLFAAIHVATATAAVPYGEYPLVLTTAAPILLTASAGKSMISHGFTAW